MSGEFVDTNILVYAYDPTTPTKHKRARLLLEQLWQEGAGRISIQVMQEFFWTITRKVPAPLEPEIALEILAELALWPVYSPSPADVLSAGKLAGTWRISFWDAMVLLAARKSGATCLWSEDLSAGQDYGGVLVRNPFAEA